MAQVVSVAEDLMLASRVDATLTAAGHHVVLARSLDAATLAGADVVVADLDAVTDLKELGALALPTLGYYSHVDAETRKAALDAGVDLVVPRSRMARELPALVDGLLGDSA
jgi:DNA-binding response OmpR family regulator